MAVKESMTTVKQSEGEAAFDEQISLPGLFTVVLGLGMVTLTHSPIGHSSMGFIPILAFAFGTIFSMVARKGRIYRFQVWDWATGSVVLTFLGLIIVAQFRTNNFMATTLSTLELVIESVFMILFLVYSINNIFRESDSYRQGASRLMFGVLVVMAIWAILNVIFYFVYPGYGETYGEAKLLSVFGVPFTKRDFPMIGTAHPNALGMVIGGVFGMLIFGYAFLKGLPKWGKYLLLAGIASSFFIILAADSRGTFLNALLAPLVIFGLMRFGSLRALIILIIALPVLQFLMLFLLSTYGDTELLQTFNRSENDLETGNSRAYIYKYSTRELSDFKQIHLYGYGRYGPYEAGVSKYYIHKFGKDITKERKLISSISHNSVFQVIFDTGYIGLVFFLLLLYRCIRRIIFLYENGFRFMLCMLTFFVYFALSGISESAMGMYNWKYWLAFVLVSMTTLMLSGNYKKIYQSDLALKPLEKNEPTAERA